MTLRIFVDTREDGGVVALHGRLSAAEVGEVERAVVERGPESRVDLTHLTGADAEGLEALRRLQESGTPLEGASHYMALLLGRSVTVGPGEPEK